MSFYSNADLESDILHNKFRTLNSRETIKTNTKLIKRLYELNQSGRCWDCRFVFQQKFVYHGGYSKIFVQKIVRNLYSYSFELK